MAHCYKDGVPTNVTPDELSTKGRKGPEGYTPQGNSLNEDSMCSKRTLKCILLLLLILFIVFY